MHTGGTGPNSADERYSLGSTTQIPILKDGAVHKGRVLYQPGSLYVFVDDLNRPVLAVPLRLDQVLSLSGGEGWIGFTAATGAAYENHDIQAWAFGGF